MQQTTSYSCQMNAYCRPHNIWFPAQSTRNHGGWKNMSVEPAQSEKNIVGNKFAKVKVARNKAEQRQLRKAKNKNTSKRNISIRHKSFRVSNFFLPNLYW